MVIVKILRRLNKLDKINFFVCLLIILGISFASGEVSVISPLNYTNHSGAVLFNVSYVNGTDFDDAINASFYYNLSGEWIFIFNSVDCSTAETIGSCNGIFDVSVLPEGIYSIKAALFNPEGNNTNSTINSHNVIFDSKPPSISLISIQNNGNYSGFLVVNISVVDVGMGVDSVYYNLSYTNGSLVQGNYTKANVSGEYYFLNLNTTGFSDGWYNISIYANDSFNNLNNSYKIRIVIDNKAPTGIINCSPDGVVVGETVSCSCSGSDATSGVASVSYNSKPSTSNTGTFTVTCTITDYSGNVFSTSTTYNVESAPITPSSSSGGGGSSSGSSVNSSDKKTYQLNNVTPGVASIITDFDIDSGLKQIQIRVKNETSRVNVSVTKYEDKPAEVYIGKSGKVYRYIKIETQNLENNLSQATLTFQITKSWLYSNGISHMNISAFKFDEDILVWNELVTLISDEDDNFYYYDSNVTSFSYFALGVRTTQFSIQEQEEELESVPEEEVQKKSLFWFWLLLGFVIASVIVVSFILMKKNKFALIKKIKLRNSKLFNKASS